MLKAFVKKIVPAPLQRSIRKMTRALFEVLKPQGGKEDEELRYWKRLKVADGFYNEHYEYFFTACFGLPREYYSGKRVLDIGCGPQGSLEWADIALERVGLDPLADKYLKLGADLHKMSYVSSPAEAIPFADDHFDVVSSFNSLDHVADLDRVVGEIKRVTKSGGMFLLLTDVNHDPTPAEPQSFSWDVVKRFSPQFEVLDEKHYERSSEGMYESIEDGISYYHSDTTPRYGVLLAKLRRL